MRSRIISTSIATSLTAHTPHPTGSLLQLVARKLVTGKPGPYPFLRVDGVAPTFAGGTKLSRATAIRMTAPSSVTETALLQAQRKAEKFSGAGRPDGGEQGCFRGGYSLRVKYPHYRTRGASLTFRGGFSQRPNIFCFSIQPWLSGSTDSKSSDQAILARIRRISAYARLC